MIQNEINSLMEKYKSRFLSKSKNQGVLTLYKYILEKEMTDSDWWNEGYGCNDVISILERGFIDNDWEDLQFDIENWSIDQLELLCLSIVSGESHYGINENQTEHNLRINKTLIKRARLLDKILDLKSGESSNYVWDNVAFLEKISILVEPSTIIEIVNKIGYFKYLKTEHNEWEEMNIITELINKMPAGNSSLAKWRSKC